MPRPRYLFTTSHKVGFVRAGQLCLVQGGRAGLRSTDGLVEQLQDVPATARLHSHSVIWEPPFPSPTPLSSQQILVILFSEIRNLRDLSGVSLDQALFLSSTGEGRLVF